MGSSSSEGPPGATNADAEEPRRVGPVRLQPTFPFVAYAVAGRRDQPPLCFTAHVDDHHALLERMEDLVRTSLAYMTQELANWRELQGLVVRVHAGAQQVSCTPLAGPPLALEDLAVAALRSQKAIFVRCIGDVRCVVEQSAPEKDDIRCRHDFWIEGAPHRRGHVYLKDDGDHEELDRALRAFVAVAEQSGVIDEYDRDLFMREAATCTDPLEAFRSFSHAMVLSPDTVDARELFRLGLRVWRMLNATVMTDYAEWVAGQLVDLSRRLSEPGVQIEMLRLQGLNLSQLGLAVESLACFERAVALLPENDNRTLELLARMSHGLAISDLSAHWETLTPDMRRRSAPDMTERLDLAERQLLAARDLLAASQEERAPRNLAFIELELLRLRDLRGDHAGALALLSALPAASHGVGPCAGFSEIDRSKYDATRIHYRLCAACKLHEAELAAATASASADSLPATWRLIRDEIPQAVAQFNALPHKDCIRDRQCAISVLVSKVSLQLALDLNAKPSGLTKGEAGVLGCLGELEQARVNLETAIALRRRIERHDVRPARAGIEYGGIAAIDIAGMLQQCLLLLADLKNDPALVWRALAVADETKGRFFKRDLAFSRPLPSAGMSTAPPLTSRVMQRALVRGEVDHRLLMADLEWSLRHDLAPAAATALREATSFEGGVSLDEVGSLLNTDPPTALLAFHATLQESIVYLVTSVDRAPYVARLMIDLGQLEEVVRHVEAEVVAALQGSQVCEPPKVLQRLLLPLLEELDGIDRLVIIPQGPWHGVPVHALLLPELWKAKRDVAMGYMPSLRAMRLLRERTGAGRAVERASIGVTTVPAREDPLGLFEREHERLVQVLRATGRPLAAIFGTEATLERMLETSVAVGIRHVLAHGIDMGVDQAMRSGVLLADGTALPSRDADPSRQKMLTATHELAHGTAASHVTLQACGLGRQHGAHRDELWGMVRAIIAGGASSVLAPMWAVSLTASSELLLDFYRRWLIDGKAPALALAQAQRTMAEGEHAARRHFAHWGAFQLIGG